LLSSQAESGFTDQLFALFALARKWQKDRRIRSLSHFPTILSLLHDMFVLPNRPPSSKSIIFVSEPISQLVFLKMDRLQGLTIMAGGLV
jgi:hypothetical protein